MWTIRVTRQTWRRSRKFKISNRYIRRALQCMKRHNGITSSLTSWRRAHPSTRRDTWTSSCCTLLRSYYAAARYRKRRNCWHNWSRDNSTQIHTNAKYIGKTSIWNGRLNSCFIFALCYRTNSWTTIRKKKCWGTSCSTRTLRSTRRRSANLKRRIAKSKSFSKTRRQKISINKPRSISMMCSNWYTKSELLHTFLALVLSYPSKTSLRKFVQSGT